MKKKKREPSMLCLFIYTISCVHINVSNLRCSIAVDVFISLSAIESKLTKKIFHKIYLKIIKYFIFTYANTQKLSLPLPKINICVKETKTNEKLERNKNDLHHQHCCYVIVGA